MNMKIKVNDHQVASYFPHFHYHVMSMEIFKV